MYFGCKTPPARVAWCIFGTFNLVWLGLVAFVLGYGWANLYFIFILAAVLFVFSTGPLCYLCCVADPPEDKKKGKGNGPLPIASIDAFESSKSEEGTKKLRIAAP
jgi:hypothetical protein